MSELEELLVAITKARLMGKPMDYNTLLDRAWKTSTYVSSQYDSWCKQTERYHDLYHDECYAKIIELIRARIEYEKSQRVV